MERFYRALVWLACVAIVVRLIAAIMYSYALQVTNSLPSGFSSSGRESVISVFFKILIGQWLIEILGWSNLIVYGATVLGAVTAWVTRRRGWLIALIVATILTLMWPAATQAWNVVTYPPMSADSLGPGIVNAVNFSIFTAPLIPVVMALVFALSHRRLAPSVTTATDVELGIVRSQL